MRAQPCTGAQLAARPSPSQSIGILSAPTTALVADELVRQVGTAIGDYTLSQPAISSLAQAVAVLTMSDPDDGVPASEIAREGLSRTTSSPVVAERARLSAAYGLQAANAAIDDCAALGTAIFNALGERRVPPDARNLLAIVASAVVNHRWKLG